MPVYTRSKSLHEDNPEDPLSIEQGANMASPLLTLEDVMLEIKKGNVKTTQKLVKFEEKNDSNQKFITDYIKSNDAELK